jgi:hypothetical protein
MKHAIAILANQTPDTTIYVNGVAILAALTILCYLLGQMADLLTWVVSIFGWTRDSKIVGGLARWALRRRTQHHIDVLRVLGIDDIALTELRRAGLVIEAKRNLPSAAPPRPDLALLQAIKPWVCELTPPYSYPETGAYYIDSMGALHYGSAEAEPLTNILVEWVRILVKHHHIEPFQCVITNKLGNVGIAQAVCSRFNTCPRPEALQWKPERFDNSRVARDLYSPPHPSDFEGLSAFLDLIEFRKSNVNGHYPNGDGSLDARMSDRIWFWERHTRRLLA